MGNSQMNASKIREEIIFGFKVFSDHLSKIPIRQSNTSVINTISPNSYGLSTRNLALDQALKSTDYLVLDGVYFSLAAILLRCKNIQKNQGPDVFYHFMGRLNRISGKAFFLGSTKNTLDLIKKQAEFLYPNISVYTYSPPFTDVFSEQQELDIVNAINSIRPDIVFVGMTCPKQEIWSIRNRKRVDAGLIICIGNVFDWFAGTQKPIHPFWFSLRLGWFIRIILRPEIFKRNIGNQLKFFWDLLLVFIRLKKEPIYRPF